MKKNNEEITATMSINGGKVHDISNGYNKEAIEDIAENLIGDKLDKYTYGHEIAKIEGKFLLVVKYSGETSIMRNKSPDGMPEEYVDTIVCEYVEDALENWKSIVKRIENEALKLRLLLLGAQAQGIVNDIKSRQRKLPLDEKGE